jgi:hypothetical protein
VFKIHLRKKIIKRKAQNHIIDSNFSIQQKHIPFYEHTCSLDELMKNQIIQNFQSFKIWKEKVTRQKDSFFKPFDKKICSMGSKCLVLGVSHMCRKLTCQKASLVVH